MQIANITYYHVIERRAVVFKCLTYSTFDDVTYDVILPLGWAGQFFLAENESHIYPNMLCQIGCRPTVVWKKNWGTDRQTKKTAALYIVDYIWIILQYEHGITQFTTEYIDVCFKTHRPTKWDDLLNTIIL